ncbi:MAG: ethylbenzene dehydrogenase-related protein, partial [Acidimicrobiia bacterium]
MSGRGGTHAMMVRAWAGLRSAAGRSGRARWLLLVLAMGAALGLRLAEINPAVAQTVTLTAWRTEQDPGLDPGAPVWQDVPAVSLPLSAQQVTFPTGGGGVTFVATRALHFNDVLYVAVEWTDFTKDDGTGRVEEFADAVAIQFPSIPASSVPAICMGQADQGVNIWQWRADNEGGPADLPPTEHGYVDLYPSTEDLFYPGRAAGNLYALSTSAVQNLVAGGFGTLAPVDEQVVAGAGTHEDGRWTVVFARPFPAPGEDQPSFALDQVIDIAFAVWDGSNGDRDGQKSVSAFAKLAVSSQTLEV